MEQKANTFLETERIGKLMAKYALPCVISLLVAALYNIVDQIFIANAEYLGSYGNAANTVVFPLTVVALSIAVMIGDGCCAFVSISLGRNDQKSAHKSIGSAVLLCVISGLVLTALYLSFQEPILTLFGGQVNEETFCHAKEYFFWITLGVPFYMFGQALNPIIRSDGSPKFAMASTLAGALANIILDPVFIFVFRWGMMGAAVATVLGQILTAALAVWYLYHMKAVRLEGQSFRIHGKLAGKYLPLGICSFLSQISLVMAMAAIQNMTLKYSAIDPIFGQIQYTQIPMAVLGIVMKFFQIVISISVGLAAGCIPVVGYNIGAGRRDRAKSLFIRLLAAEAIVGAAALLIVELFPRQLIGIFGAAAALSVSLGKNETKHIHRSVGNSILCSFLGGAALILISYIWGDGLLRLIGATDANLALAHDYGFIIYTMIPLALAQNTMASIKATTRGGGKSAPPTCN